MNPNLTANLRAEAELKAQVQQEQLEQIASDIERAVKALKWAKLTADQGIKDSHTALYTAICDALNSCNEAANHLNDAPDQ